MRQAFGEVRDDVMKATDNKQEPYVYGSLGGGQMALVSPATSAAPAAPAAAPSVGDSSLQMRQDYEFAERVGTKQAWTYFLQHYPDGFYANLAKAQLDKLTVSSATPSTIAPAAPAKPVQPSTQVAALPTDASRTTINPADLARSVQTEMKRVGCYSGSVDGSWSAGSQRALDQFNKYAPAKLDTKLASNDALDALRAKPARVCPLVCDHGTRADGDSCVKIVCKDGFQVGDDNTCEKIPPKRNSQPTASKQQQAAAVPIGACAVAAIGRRWRRGSRRGRRWRADHLRRPWLRATAEGLHGCCRADRPGLSVRSPHWPSVLKHLALRSRKEGTSGSLQSHGQHSTFCREASDSAVYLFARA